MTNVSLALGSCGSHMIEPYHFGYAIVASGPLCMLGWAILFMIPVSACLIMLKHNRVNPSGRSTRFYGFAHACFLAYLLFVTVGGSFWNHPSHTMISLSIAIGIAAASTAAVTLSTKKKPIPGLWSCFGLASIFIDVMLFGGVLLLIIHLPQRFVSGMF